MENSFDFITKCRKRHNIFNTSICFLKSLKNNIAKVPWFDITMEHSYQEVEVDKKTSYQLYEKGIIIGDGDLICTKCGTISHSMVEHKDIKGYFYCDNNHCVYTKSDFSAQLFLYMDSIAARVESFLSRK